MEYSFLFWSLWRENGPNPIRNALRVEVCKNVPRASDGAFGAVQHDVPPSQKHQIQNPNF